MCQNDDRIITPDTLDFYTVAETAAILSVSKKLVFTWIKDGALPAVRLGPGQRLIRIRRVDLEGFIAEGEFNTPSDDGQEGEDDDLGGG